LVYILLTIYKQRVIILKFVLVLISGNSENVKCDGLTAQYLVPR